MKLNVKLLHKSAYTPSYFHHGEDAGLDLYAPYTVTIPIGQIIRVKTRIAVEIPQGFFGFIRPRSGLATKGLLLMDSGVIDSGYRGEIMVGLTNVGKQVIDISQGNRFAQMVIIPCATVKVWVVDELSESERGQGGYGSTGL